jgi:hypothetical protein
MFIAEVRTKYINTFRGENTVCLVLKKMVNSTAVLEGVSQSWLRLVSTLLTIYKHSFLCLFFKLSPSAFPT